MQLTPVPLYYSAVLTKMTHVWSLTPHIHQNISLARPSTSHENGGLGVSFKIPRESTLGVQVLVSFVFVEIQTWDRKIGEWRLAVRGFYSY